MGSNYRVAGQKVVELGIKPRGSKYPIFEVSGPKNLSGHGFCNQKP